MSNHTQGKQYEVIGGVLHHPATRERVLVTQIGPDDKLTVQRVEWDQSIWLVNKSDLTHNQPEKTIAPRLHDAQISFRYDGKSIRWLIELSDEFGADSRAGEASTWEKAQKDAGKAMTEMMFWA